MLAGIKGGLASMLNLDESLVDVAIYTPGSVVLKVRVPAGSVSALLPGSMTLSLPAGAPVSSVYIESATTLLPTQSPESNTGVSLFDNPDHLAPRTHAHTNVHARTRKSTPT